MISAELPSSLWMITPKGNSTESVSHIAGEKEVTLPPEAAPGYQTRLSLTLKVAECNWDVPTAASASSPQQFHGTIDATLISMLRGHRSGVRTGISLVPQRVSAYHTERKVVDSIYSWTRQASL
ncbi:hypothetical protein FHL15_008294 [Xylaria flabelliformis]|uniref:Uncharacterized protein n=1 Tax=Xylaria flabelliformis TaxID=2512241 RepID=A0A553HSF7_9PEZI|nr:hypothetical protein FHL15_008294 [Xylaria flabelliformis]